MREAPCLSNLPQEIKQMIIIRIDPHTLPSIVLLNREFNKILSKKKDHDYFKKKITQEQFLSEDWLVRQPTIPTTRALSNVFPGLENRFDWLRDQIGGLNMVVLYLVFSHIEKSKEYTGNISSTEHSTSFIPPSQITIKGPWKKTISQALDGGLPYLMTLQDQVATPILKATNAIDRLTSYTSHKRSNKGKLYRTKGNLYRTLLIHWRLTLGSELDKSSEKHMGAKTRFASPLWQLVFFCCLPISDQGFYIYTMSILASIIRVKFNLRPWLCNQGDCPSPGPGNRSIHEKCQDRAVMMRLFRLPVIELVEMMHKVFDPNEEFPASAFFKQSNLPNICALSHSHHGTLPCTCLSGNYTLAGNDTMLIQSMVILEWKIMRKRHISRPK